MTFAGNVKEALQLTYQLLKISPYHQRALGNKQYYENIIQSQQVQGRQRGETGKYVQPRKVYELLVLEVKYILDTSI